MRSFPCFWSWYGFWACAVVCTHAGRADASEPATQNAKEYPTLTSGVRRVDRTPSAPVLSDSKSTAIEQAPKTPSHQTGRPPRTPKAKLPDGAEKPKPVARARRGVARGPTAEELLQGKNDPELRALAEAERTLFTTRLKGVRPGWSWSHDTAAAGGATEVLATGLPPGAGGAHADTPALGLVADSEWLRSLSMPDLPVRMDERVVKYLKFYRDSEKGQAIIHVWAKKAGRYAPALRAEFEKAGLPRDLIWLSLIESGHNPTISSPAGAVGLWQFIASSGRMYGLTVDRWVDERLDPVRSTQAAIRFLSDLYQRFGSWDLAMAAYNMGYAGMSRAIRKFNTNDFWQLCQYEAGIPWETTLYVPKILAIAIVMNNKRAFKIDDVVPEPPESFDTVLVPPGQSLADMADAAKLSSALLTRMNPQYLAQRTPPSGAGQDADARKWPVRAPSGTGKTLSRALLGGENQALYRVRFGETLESIAEKGAFDSDELANLNGIKRHERLKSGTVLLLPTARRISGESQRKVVVVPPGTFRYRDRKRVFYEVRQGDSLSVLATAFGVTQAELLAWNSLDATARLHADMVLQVFVDRARSLKRVNHLSENEVRLLEVGTPAFYDHFEALNGRVRLVVSCKEGDTLASLGKQYNMSVGSMERVNRRSRRDPLLPGEKIIVYVERENVRASAASEPVLLGTISAPHPELLPGDAHDTQVPVSTRPRAASALD